MTADHRVAIVGGGLAGMFAALALVAEGIEDVVVLEASETPGGVVRTIQRDGYTVEPAAGSFVLPHPNLSALLDLAGADLTPTRASSRYLYARGRLARVAQGPALALSPALSTRGKLRAALEPFIASAGHKPDDSVHERMTHRFGAEAGALVAWLMSAGVYAGDPRVLSLDQAFPGIERLLRSHGSIVRGAVAARKRGLPRRRSWVPSDTMSGLADSLSGTLGPKMHTDWPVERVERSRGGWTVHGRSILEADQVVLAAGPLAAGRMLGGEVSQVLGGAIAAPVAVVALGGIEPPPGLPDGYGILTGPDSGLLSLGILLESSYAPHRAPDGGWLVKVIAGGARHPEVVEWTDTKIIDTIGVELSNVLGSPVEASFAEVVRHTPGIPQYPSSHGAWLDDVQTKLGEGLHLGGWGYRGVGISHIADDAFALVAAVKGRS